MPRFDPAGPAALYRTYRISAPRQTHFRPATCEEAGCPAWLHGWRTIVPADSPQAEYIRHDKTRSAAEERQPGGLAAFTFGPGQRCFGAGLHRVRTDRPDRLAVLGGDFRGNPLGTAPRVHARPEFFIEDMEETLDGVRTAQERG
jgi:hypothetical protein